MNSWSTPPKECEHDYVYKYAKQTIDGSHYERKEFYYCRKCLSQEVIEMDEYGYYGNYGSSKKPDWWEN